jgi:hypothetical protein
MPLTFPPDTGPLAYNALPGSNVGLSWHNVQRKRLKKFATQYMAEDSKAVVTLRSQGEPDTSIDAVQATRAGFTELRVRLPVLSQYYRYTMLHGGGGDAAVLSKIKMLCLAWVDKNQPTGKPIDETNFEGLLRVLKARWNDFSAVEQTRITAWLNALKAEREAWMFPPAPNEGRLLYTNHYTHHYKILLFVYDLLNLVTSYTTLISTIQSFATQNFPFGNVTIITPQAYAVTGADSVTKRFDINGNFLSRFPATVTFTITGNTQGNNGTYTVASAQYLSGSNKTRIFTVENVPGVGGNGTLTELFSDLVHDIPRPTVSAGESIDYVKRDALHYQQYTLEPWLEIALQVGGTTLQSVVQQGFDFLANAILIPGSKRYEFVNSTVPFDAVRWQTSQPLYLQPTAMYRPDDIARCVLAYDYYRRLTNPAFALDERLYALAIRSERLPSSWPQYFRWVFGGLYG